MMNRRFRRRQFHRRHGSLLGKPHTLPHRGPVEEDVIHPEGTKNRAMRRLEAALTRRHIWKYNWARDKIPHTHTAKHVMKGTP